LELTRPGFASVAAMKKLIVLLVLVGVAVIAAQRLRSS
jgi:hypothetical protein